MLFIPSTHRSMSMLLAHARAYGNVASLASPPLIEFPQLLRIGLPLGVASSTIQQHGSLSQAEEVQLFCDLIHGALKGSSFTNCSELIEDCIRNQHSVFHQGYALSSGRGRTKAVQWRRHFHPLSKGQIISDSTIISFYIRDLLSIPPNEVISVSGSVDAQVREELLRFTSLIQRYGDCTARSMLRSNEFDELWKMSMRQTADSFCGLDEHVLSCWTGMDFYTEWYRRSQPVQYVTYETFRLMYTTSTTLFASVTAQVLDNAREPELGEVDSESIGSDAVTDVSTSADDESDAE